MVNYSCKKISEDFSFSQGAFVTDGQTDNNHANSSTVT